MNVTRINAMNAYRLASANLKKAEMGTDERAWMLANDAYQAATKNLVAAEMSYPTASEMRRADEKIRMHNNGYRD